MARLILENVEPEILEALELRAKHLGSTPAKEASRILRERLRLAPAAHTHATAEQAAADADLREKLQEARDAAAPASGRAPLDERFVRRDGVLVFTVAVADEDMPDHRTLREDRIDGLLPKADG